MKATNYILKRGSELATDYPYRKACCLLYREISDYVGKDLIWYWIKRLSKLLEIKERIRTQELLNKPKSPPKSKYLKAIIEIDATNIHKQYKGRATKENLEAKLTICYAGVKERNNKNYLENKILYAGVENTDTFGSNLYSLLLEEKLNITLIENKLLISDGEDG